MDPEKKKLPADLEGRVVFVKPGFRKPGGTRQGYHVRGHWRCPAALKNRFALWQATGL